MDDPFLQLGFPQSGQGFPGQPGLGHTQPSPGQQPEPEHHHSMVRFPSKVPAGFTGEWGQKANYGMPFHLLVIVTVLAIGLWYFLPAGGVASLIQAASSIHLPDQAPAAQAPAVAPSAPRAPKHTSVDDMF